MLLIRGWDKVLQVVGWNQRRFALAIALGPAFRAELVDLLGVVLDHVCVLVDHDATHPSAGLGATKEPASMWGASEG
jgi:hypothetical protein